MTSSGQNQGRRGWTTAVFLADGIWGKCSWLSSKSLGSGDRMIKRVGAWVGRFSSWDRPSSCTPLNTLMTATCRCNLRTIAMEVGAQRHCHLTDASYLSSQSRGQTGPWYQQAALTLSACILYQFSTGRCRAWWIMVLSILHLTSFSVNSAGHHHYSQAGTPFKISVRRPGNVPLYWCFGGGVAFKWWDYFLGSALLWVPTNVSRSLAFGHHQCCPWPTHATWTHASVWVANQMEKSTGWRSLPWATSIPALAGH